MDITFDQYQQNCLNTAVYPSMGNNLIYPVLGLCGETGELFEKVIDKPINAELVIKEMGDVLWYIFMTLYELKITGSGLNKIFSTQTFNQYQFNIDSKKLKNDNILTIGYMIMYTSLSIAETTKKIMRDDKSIISNDKKSIIIQKIKELLWYLTQLILSFKISTYDDICNLNLGNVANKNISKLNDRKNRNVLKGSGDER